MHCERDRTASLGDWLDLVSTTTYLREQSGIARPGASIETLQGKLYTSRTCSADCKDEYGCRANCIISSSAELVSST